MITSTHTQVTGNAALTMSSTNCDAFAPAGQESVFSDSFAIDIVGSVAIIHRTLSENLSTSGVTPIAPACATFDGGLKGIVSNIDDVRVAPRRRAFSFGEINDWVSIPRYPVDRCLKMIPTMTSWRARPSKAIFAAQFLRRIDATHRYYY